MCRNERIDSLFTKQKHFKLLLSGKMSCLFVRAFIEVASFISLSLISNSSHFSVQNQLKLTIIINMYELDIFIVGLVVIAIFVVVSLIFFSVSGSDSIVNLISIIIYILRQFYFHRYNLSNSIRIFHLYLAHRDLIVLEFVVDIFPLFLYV